VANVAQAADDVPFETAIRPVPADKLQFNKLPNHWRMLIANGWQNTHLVEQYLSRHHDPLTGERIAQAMRVRYRYLKAQNLPPRAIMSSLYEMVTGVGSVALVRTGLTPHNLPADCSNDRADECSTWTNSSKAAISIAK
jgi:hypothetical protein